MFYFFAFFKTKQYDFKLKKGVHEVTCIVWFVLKREFEPFFTHSLCLYLIFMLVFCL